MATRVFLLPTSRHQCTAAKWSKSTVVIQVSAVWKSHNKIVNKATYWEGIHINQQFYDPGVVVTRLVLFEVRWGVWPNQWPSTLNLKKQKNTCCQILLVLQTLTLTNLLADVQPPYLVTVHLSREQTGKTITILSKVTTWDNDWSRQVWTCILHMQNTWRNTDEHIVFFFIVIAIYFQFLR